MRRLRCGKRPVRHHMSVSNGVLVRVDLERVEIRYVSAKATNTGYAAYAEIAKWKCYTVRGDTCRDITIGFLLYVSHIVALR